MTSKPMTFGLVSDQSKKKPIAGKATSAWGGIEIIDIEHGINDFVIWRWSNESKLHKSRAYYDSKRGAYFKVNGRREYLDEYMRY